MDLFLALIDFVLHIDVHLVSLIREYGAWTYAILFLIVFCETGLVVTPILPGDSLLFAAGALAARGSMSATVLFVVLVVAAVLGDSVNYSIGRALARRARGGRMPLVKPEHLARTQGFFQKYGGKTIVIARFIPIVRTYAPFVAGAAHMEYGRFAAFNVGGALAWIAIFLLGGYWFGNLPAVRDNFGLVVVAIIAASLVPPLLEMVQRRRVPAGGA